METPEQLALDQEATKLLTQMNARQLRRAARFMELFIKQGMSYEDAVAIVKLNFPKRK